MFILKNSTKIKKQTINLLFVYIKIQYTSKISATKPILGIFILDSKVRYHTIVPFITEYPVHPSKVSVYYCP